MSEVVFATSGYTVMLDAMLGGLVPFVGLFTNVVDFDVPLTPASFTPPVMLGYSLRPVKKWTPSRLRAGLAISVCDPVQFDYVGGPLPLPVRGYYATDGPGGPLLWAWPRAGAPFQFSTSSAVLLVSVRMTFPAPCP